MIVEPPDPLERGELVLVPASVPASSTFLEARRRMTSVLNSPMTESASALSYESPRLPTDGSIQAAASRSASRVERYCTPRSLCGTGATSVMYDLDPGPFADVTVR